MPRVVRGPQAERLSLLVLGRRQLVRARNAGHGCSVTELVLDPGRSGCWLVAVSAGARVADVPVAHTSAVQVMQGRVRVGHADGGALALPGDLLVGPVALDDLSALADVVLVVTGKPRSERELRR